MFRSVPSKVHTLRFVAVSLKSLLILRLSFPLSFLFAIYLARNWTNSCRISHNLTFDNLLPTVSFNIFPYPLYLPVVWQFCLQLHFSGSQPLVTCCFWALDMWLVYIEIHRKYKIHRNLEDLVPKYIYVKYLNFLLIACWIGNILVMLVNAMYYSFACF